MGRVFKPSYTVKGSNGDKVKKVTEAWYIEFTDAQGRTVRRKAGLSKEQAKDALRKAEAEVLDEKNGLPTRRIADIPCAELAEEYLTDQERRVSSDHHKELKRRLYGVLNGTRSVYLADLTPEAVDTFLDGLSDQDLSARTLNTYLQSVKGMFTWAVAKKKVPYNPLSSVSSRSGEAVRKRRPLSQEEAEQLLAVALEGPARRLKKCYVSGLTPAQQLETIERGKRNAMIYRIMLRTGLRLNELKNLKWRDVDIDTGRLFCRSEWTKNRQDADLPLHPQLVSDLREWKSEQAGTNDDLVVKVPSSILSDFNDDIVAAKIDKTDAAGRTVDLHSLRHTFSQHLNAAGVDVKTMQALMRHSTPTLTVGVYLHNDQKRMSEALGNLPELQPRKPAQENEQETLQKTGTDDLPQAENGPLPPNIRQEENEEIRKSLSIQHVSKPTGSALQAGHECSIPFARFFLFYILMLVSVKVYAFSIFSGFF